jgi:hypothetical protein
VPDPLYVAARRVLLDGLAALGPHLGSLVLAGAQAVYLHAGEGDLAVAPFTTDGDLVIDPAKLADEPLLSEALLRVGFSASDQPGRWIRDSVPVDFLVPEALAGRRGRGAALGRHGTRFARQARGLEGAIVDSAVMRLGALESGDARVFDVAVAGPAALLVSKLIKLGERIGQRARDKDALDLFRLLRATPTETLGLAVRRLLSSDIARPVTQEALTLLEKGFRTREGRGNDMLVRAVEGLEPEAELRASCSALAQELLESVARVSAPSTSLEQVQRELDADREER